MQVAKQKDTPQKTRLRKKRNKIVMVMIINLLILVVLGLVLVIWIIWQNGQKTVDVEPLPAKETPKIVEAPKPDPTGPVGVSTQVFTSPVQQGGNASLAIRTRPEAACSITVTYDNEISKDAGLLPKPADECGVVQWTWTVESSRPVGKWPVDVTCGLGKESGYHREELVVTAKN